MQRRRILTGLATLLLILVVSAGSSWAQLGFYFGQNKVHYKDFSWKVFRTEHFDVHYYPEEEMAARDAARMAERAYDYLSEVLEHRVKRRIPLILYASVNDFQQTNVVSGLLGEGTRGVTEGLKNRVILPLTGSYRDFNHVLAHELVHAFQFDILTGGQGTNSLGRIDIPLWFVEGMAEYLSVGMDNITRAWVRAGLMNNDLISVGQLSTTYDIRVYRFGQAVWYYVGETYGKKKIGHILRTAVRLGSAEQAFIAQIGLDYKKLTEVWHDAMRELVLSDEPLHTPELIATQVTRQSNYFHRMNVVPAISPDGTQITYIANKNLVEEIYLATEREDGSFGEEALVKGGQSKNFESLRFLENSINWSRDGSRIAFVSKVGRDDAIYIMDPKEREGVERLVFPELNGLLTPSFSPDGRKLVFVGVTGGISDLYIFDRNSQELQRLTSDRYSELQPQWSPDGRWIAFVTDRGPGTDVEKLLFGDADLALYSLSTGKIELLTDLKGNATSPQWSPDSRTIAFVSDHQGIQNIYRIDLVSRRIAPVTTLLTAVAGITENTPAMSWSADGRYLAFSSFWQGGWQIFRMRWPESDTRLTTLEEENEGQKAGAALSSVFGEGASARVRPDSVWLPQIPDANDLYREYALASPDSLERRGYSNKFSLEGAAVGGSVGGFFGPVGGAQFLFGDLLGNHNLIISTSLEFDLLRPDLGVAYINQARRLNYGLSAFQSNNQFGTVLGGSRLGFVRQTYRGLTGFALYPFSRFSRIEFSAGLTSVDQDLLIDTFSGGQRDRQTLDLDRVDFGQGGAALVFDNTVFGPVGPMSGSRSRFSLFQTVGDFRSTTFIGDYRRYQRMSSRSVLAYRLLGGFSKGRDAQVFSIGGPFTFRGTEFSELFGTNFLVQNLEYRFPMFPFAPPNYDYLSALVFFDLGAAWGLDVPGLSKNTFQPFSTDGGFRLKDLKAAFGIGARFYLGYFALRYDLAWPTDLRSIGSPISLFSIGVDF